MSPAPTVPPPQPVRASGLPAASLAGLLTLLAMLLLAAPRGAAQAGGAGPAQAPVIKDVRMIGNVGIEHELMLANLRTRPGERYSEAAVNEDMHHLNDTYGVLVADVLLEPGPVVVFVLRHVTHYAWIDIQGNDRYRDRTLYDAARLRQGRGASPDEITKARTLIADYYRQRGHHFVQVDARLATSPQGEQGVQLLVFEGPEVELDAIRIEGLTALDPDAADDVLSSAPGFWAWLVGKDFIRANLDRDVVVLEHFVRGEGYLDARVALGPLEWNDDRDEVVATMVVEEGDRYTVRSLTVEGNEAYTAEELLQDAALQVGKPYRSHDRLRVQREIRRLYGRIGHIDARISMEEVYDLEQPQVDVIVRVEEGRKKFVRDVIIRGNSNTRDGVIRRYLTVYPGDVVDLSEITYSEDALIALDYFTDLTGVPKVRVTTRDTPDPDTVDVIVDVEDTASGLFTFIVGAGSDNGLFGGITIDKKNFDVTRRASTWGRFFTEFFGAGEAYHGGGQRLYMSLSPGTRQSTYDIVFQEPWLDERDERPWGYTAEVYRRLRFFREYRQGRQGLGLFFEHRYSRESAIALGPRIEEVEIDDVDQRQADVVTGEQTEFAEAEGTHRRHALEAVWRHTDLDSLYEPTDGSITRIEFDLVGGPLGGEVDAARLDLINEWFLPMGEDDEGLMRVLHPRLAIGVVEPLGGNPLPFFENLFVGGGTGPYAVRGFDYQGVGPHEEIRFNPNVPGGGPVLVKKDGDPVGGRLGFAASVEALFPLVTQYNPFRDRDEILIKGVLFTDAGNLVPEAHLDDLLRNIRLSTGAGVRMRLPALGGVVLQLDFAHVLRSEDEDERRALSFELTRRF